MISGQSPDNDSDPVAQARAGMSGVLENFRGELRSLRSGRASPAFFDSVRVLAYENQMPLNQLASVSVSENSLLLVQVWDRQLTGAVEKALRLWDPDLSIETAGDSLRVRLPPMTEQRRQELVKMASKMAEKAKVSARGCRRDAMDTLRNMEKEKAVSEDEKHTLSKKVQQVTDGTISDIDAVFQKKKSEITGGGSQ